MKMKVFILFAAIAVAFTANIYSQKRVTASKHYITRNINVGSFHGIKVTGSMDVIYKQTSGSPSVSVYGSDNIIEMMNIVVEDGNLRIGFKKNTSIQNKGKLIVNVSSPTLDALSISGSGDVTFDNGIKSKNDLSVRISGSGSISGKEIKCKNLSATITGSGDISLSNLSSSSVNAKISGSGDMDFSGQTANAEYHISGSGDINAVNLTAQNISARISGSGDISCHAIKNLQGSVSGSGEVSYKGNPQINFSKKGLHKL